MPILIDEALHQGHADLQYLRVCLGQAALADGETAPQVRLRGGVSPGHQRGAPAGAGHIHHATLLGARLRGGLQLRSRSWSSDIALGDSGGLTTREKVQIFWIAMEWSALFNLERRSGRPSSRRRLG